MTMTTEITIRNMSDINQTTPDRSWFHYQFGGYPIVYPITIYYLFPIIQCGRIIHVLWYLIGCVGNILCMKIWSIPRMKRLNSSAMYLLCITICDLTYQVMHVFLYLKYFWGLPSLGVPGLCQIWNVINVIPQYASQLFVLGFTIERFISIFRPFNSERFSRYQRAPREITAISIFVVAIALPQAYFWRLDRRGFCEIRVEEDVVDIYGIWSFVTETIAFLVVPAVTLFLNIFVLRETRKALKEHQRSNCSTEENGEPRIHHKGKIYRPSTITLLCISFFRIFTQLPVSITYTMQNMDGFTFGKLMPLEQMQNDPQWRVFLKYWGTRIIIEVIGASHHALSIFIFYASTKQFRAEFSRLFYSLRACLIRQKAGPLQMDEGKYGTRYSISQTQITSANLTRFSTK